MLHEHKEMTFLCFFIGFIVYVFFFLFTFSFQIQYSPCMDLPQKYTGHDCDCSQLRQCLDVFQCVHPSIGFPLHVVQNRSIFMGTTLCCTGKRKKAVRHRNRCLLKYWVVVRDSTPFWDTLNISRY